MTHDETMEPVTLFGCGKMGRAYAPVLRKLARSVRAVGRSAAGAEQFQADTGIETSPGGWEQAIERRAASRGAVIVAVPVEDLAACAVALMDAGTRRILLEKPGGIDSQAIADVARKAEETGAEVHVAYNRRFYAATRAAREMILADGGVRSFHFEFTEMPERVTAHVTDPATLRNWYLANSSHVVDLAFHLGGAPEELKGIVTGSLDWHPSGSAFVGHGRTDRGALFSYNANWSCPGSFRIELATSKRKLFLRPIERLSTQDTGTFHDEPVELDYTLDSDFKPGVFREVTAFLDRGADLALLPTIQEHRRRLDQLLGPLRGGIRAGW